MDNQNQLTCNEDDDDNDDDDKDDNDTDDNSGGCDVKLSLLPPRVINLKFPLQPHQKYYITQYEELGFS